MNLNTIGVSAILFRNSKSLMFHISFWLKYRHYVIVSSCFTKHQLTSLPDSKAERQWSCEWKMLQCGEVGRKVYFCSSVCVWLFFLRMLRHSKNIRPMNSECPQSCLLVSYVFPLNAVKTGAWKREIQICTILNQSMACSIQNSWSKGLKQFSLELKHCYKSQKISVEWRHARGIHTVCRHVITTHLPFSVPSIRSVFIIDYTE